MWFDAWVTVRFSEKHAAGSFRLSVCTHHVVGKLLMGLMMMSIGFSSGLSGLGCAVHDLGVSRKVFFGHSLQKTEVLKSR